MFDKNGAYVAVTDKWLRKPGELKPTAVARYVYRNWGVVFEDGSEFSIEDCELYTDSLDKLIADLQGLLPSQCHHKQCCDCYWYERCGADMVAEEVIARLRGICGERLGDAL